MITNNTLLGQFDLGGILSASQIEITFDIDTNNTLNVLAQENSIGWQNKIIINSGHLSEEEIERAMREADKYRAEDERQRERVAAQNALESYCFNIKRTMEDPNLRKNVVGKCQETLAWLDVNQETASKEEFECHAKKLVDVIIAED